MKRNYVITGLFVCCMALGLAGAGAAVINNPTLTPPSTNMIDPTGVFQDRDFDASNVTSQSTLEGRADMRSIQDFDGFVGAANNDDSATNIFTFSDTSLPHIRFTISGNTFRGAGGARQGGVDNLYQSSLGSAYNMAGGAGSATVTIDFGHWDGSTWNGNTNEVAAAGFMLLNFFNNTVNTARYYDSSNNLLVTQAATGVLDDDAKGNHSDVYYGYVGSSPISYITIERANSSGGSLTALHDFAFAIPEPGSISLIALAFGGLLFLRRKCNGAKSR
jgi:hypothetical protein